MDPNPTDAPVDAATAAEATAATDPTAVVDPTAAAEALATSDPTAATEGLYGLLIQAFPDLQPWLLDPLFEVLFGVTVGPTLPNLIQGLFWLFMAGFAWWMVGYRTKDADVDGAPVLLRISALILRIAAVSLCLLLAVELLGILSSRDLVAAIGKVFDAKITHLGDSDVTVSTLVILIAVVVGTFWGTSVLAKWSTQALKDRGVDTSGTIGVLLNLGRYVFIIVGLAIALTTAGIDLTALFTLGAVFAVTIGFALQNISQNFVSGIILLVEGAIRPGDVLEVEGRVVRVVKMGVRSTVARTMDDEDLILPNALLAQGTVKNLTMIDDALRIKATVSVAYESDLDEIKGVLERAASQVRDPRAPKEPVVLLQSFDDSGITFDTFVWISDPWLAPKMRSDLRLSIWRSFRDAGVVIPFPQVDVHMDPVEWVNQERPVA